MTIGPIRIIEVLKDGVVSSLVLVWDQDVLKPENHEKLVTALGNLVDAKGGTGDERARSVLYVSPERIDKRFAWSLGTTSRLCRRKKLPHHVMPNGEIRLVESEVEALVCHILASGQGAETSGIDGGITD